LIFGGAGEAGSGGATAAAGGAAAACGGVSGAVGSGIRSTPLVETLEKC
jgi:hypothetical protein